MPTDKLGQKNSQLVWETVGYARYDTPEAVAWPNAVYGLLESLREPVPARWQATYQGLRGP